MDFESKITFEIPTNLDFDTLIQSNNYTLLLNKVQTSDNLKELSNSDLIKSLIGELNSEMNKDYGHPQSFSDPNYERFIGDVWVGIVLTLMILSTIFCMCSCYLYHKFRQWKNSVLIARAATAHADQIHYDVESLPSYTIVSGLPSYNDALEQFKKIKQNDYAKVHRPSVIKLFSSTSTMSSDQPDGLQETKYNFNQIPKNSYHLASYVQTKDPQSDNKHLMAAPSYEDGATFGESSSTPISIIVEEQSQSPISSPEFLRIPSSILFENEKQIVDKSCI